MNTNHPDTQSTTLAHVTHRVSYCRRTMRYIIEDANYDVLADDACIMSLRLTAQTMGLHDVADAIEETPDYAREIEAANRLAPGAIGAAKRIETTPTTAAAHALDRLATAVRHMAEDVERLQHHNARGHMAEDYGYAGSINHWLSEIHETSTAMRRMAARIRSAHEEG